MRAADACPASEMKIAQSHTGDIKGCHISKGATRSITQQEKESQLSLNVSATSQKSNKH